jgi:hypothetical protein
VTLHQTIINRGAEPEETPDHNSLQVLFLDDEFCMRFARMVRPDLEQKLQKEFLERRDGDLRGSTPMAGAMRGLKK